MSRLNGEPIRSLQLPPGKPVRRGGETVAYDLSIPERELDYMAQDDPARQNYVARRMETARRELFQAVSEYDLSGPVVVTLETSTTRDIDNRTWKVRQRLNLVQLDEARYQRERESRANVPAPAIDPSPERSRPGGNRPPNRRTNRGVERTAGGDPTELPGGIPPGEDGGGGRAEAVISLTATEPRGQHADQH